MGSKMLATMTFRGGACEGNDRIYKFFIYFLEIIMLSRTYI